MFKSKCKTCGETFNVLALIEGECDTCRTNHRLEQEKAKAETAQAAENLQHEINCIELTTESAFVGVEFVRAGFVSSQVVYGQHAGRDVMALFRNFVGGRAKGVEQVLQDAERDALNELKAQAHSKGADMIIGLSVEYKTIDQTVLVTAQGTAIRTI